MLDQCRLDLISTAPTANSSCLSVSDDNTTDDDYHVVFKSYSKIWSDTALTQKHSYADASMRNNVSRDVNNSATTTNKGDNCNSFSQALQGQLGSYSSTSQYSAKQSMDLSSQVNGDALLSDFNRNFEQWAKHQKTKSQSYVDSLAHHFVYSYQVYSVSANPQPTYTRMPLQSKTCNSNYSSSLNLGRSMSSQASRLSSPAVSSYNL